MSLRLPASHPLAQQYLTPAEIQKATRGKRKLRMPGEQTAEDKIHDGLRARLLTAGMLRQHRFHVERLFRFDFAWPALMLAVEYDGLIIGQDGKVSGGHGTVSGIRNGNEKSNLAQLAGWTMLRYDAQAVRDGSMYDQVESTLKARGYVHG